MDPPGERAGPAQQAVLGSQARSGGPARGLYRCGALGDRDVTRGEQRHLLKRQGRQPGQDDQRPVAAADPTGGPAVGRQCSQGCINVRLVRRHQSLSCPAGQRRPMGPPPVRRRYLFQRVPLPVNEFAPIEPSGDRWIAELTGPAGVSRSRCECSSATATQTYVRIRVLIGAADPRGLSEGFSGCCWCCR